MKKIVKKLLPIKLVAALRGFKNNYFLRYSIRSYSQEGEDMILRRIFEKKQNGFYVDVGAHHPFRFSNTYFFYRQGWQGINIDAMPGSMKLFEKFRSRDINLEIPVGSSDRELTYFSFNEPALNGFSADISRERDGKNGYFIQEEIPMKVSKLSSLLDKFLPKDWSIDFLSVDVEGLDLDILKSNDWVKYRPRVILIEIFDEYLDVIDKSDTFIFLKDKNYRLYAKAVNTVIFVDSERVLTNA